MAMCMYIKAECLLRGIRYLDLVKYSCIIRDSLCILVSLLLLASRLELATTVIGLIGLASGPLYSCICH